MYSRFKEQNRFSTAFVNSGKEGGKWIKNRFDQNLPTNMVQKSLTSALQELSTFRVRGHRNSVEVVQKGLFVLEHKDGIKKLGDECENETGGRIAFQLNITLRPSVGLS